MSIELDLDWIGSRL